VRYQRESGRITQIYGAKWWARKVPTLEEFRARRRIQNFQKDQLFCEKILNILRARGPTESTEIYFLLGVENQNEQKTWRVRFQRFAQKQWIRAQYIRKSGGGIRLILSCPQIQNSLNS